MSKALAPAHEIPGGALVDWQGGRWLKAQRDSKDYVNHYLVPLTPAPDLALVYIDPDTKLGLLALKLRPEALLPRLAGEATQPGDLIKAADGRFFLKALDVKKDGQRHMAYVAIDGGEVRPRRERPGCQAFCGWKLIGD